MIKIDYKELGNFLDKENKYKLRNPYTDNDIVYPVETFRSSDTDEYIIYIRHKIDASMMVFDVHCYTEEFAKECYNYIKSIHLSHEHLDDTVTLNMTSDYFIKYLVKEPINILDIDISPCLIATTFEKNLIDYEPEIVVKVATKQDMTMIEKFQQGDSSPRNRIKYYTSSIDSVDIRNSMFIALKDDCVVGYLVSAPYNTGDYVEVQDIYIYPGYRGNGYGTKLATIYKNYIIEQGYFKVILRKNGMEQIRFHDLRHSCATLMLNNNEEMKKIQAWLGHSTITITADTYAHLDMSSKVTSAEKISDSLAALAT